MKRRISSFVGNARLPRGFPRQTPDAVRSPGKVFAHVVARAQSRPRRSRADPDTVNCHDGLSGARLPGIDPLGVSRTAARVLRGPQSRGGTVGCRTSGASRRELASHPNARERLVAPRERDFRFPPSADLFLPSPHACFTRTNDAGGSHREVRVHRGVARPAQRVDPAVPVSVLALDARG